MTQSEGSSKQIELQTRLRPIYENIGGRDIKKHIGDEPNFVKQSSPLNKTNEGIRSESLESHGSATTFEKEREVN